MPTPPHVSAFLIADQVFQQIAGKWCVVGVFDRVIAPRYPSIHPTLGLFFVLSDASGSYDLTIQFRNEQDQILGAFDGVRVEVPHRLARVYVGLQTTNLFIPAAGRYFFKLFFNGQMAIEDIPVEAVLAGGSA